MIASSTHHPFRHMLALLRPRQWVKNLFVTAPLFFSLNFTEYAYIQRTLLALFAFILASSISYIINDIRDAKEDREHPEKCCRPIASGAVSRQSALLFAALLLMPLLAVLMMLPQACTVIIGAYIIWQLIYTYYLRALAIIDVMAIAAGFILRVLMGAYAIAVPMSPWIILTTYLLALFLGYGKRFYELHHIPPEKQRRSLGKCTHALLDRLITISCCATLISYALYTVQTGNSNGNTALAYTIGFVALGLFRYLQILHVEHQGGEPEKQLLSDPLSIVNALLWLATTIAILLY